MKHAHNFKDITGQRYGYLTALRPSGVEKTFNKKRNKNMRRAVWLFHCDCGKNVRKCRATLEQYKRQNLTISCGCKSFSEKLGPKHGLWKGYGEIPGTFFNYLKKRAKKGGHRKKDFKFDVSIEYLWGLFLEQNRKCAFSGETLCFGTLAQVKNKKERQPLASLDRIDSSKGYIKGNVQWVHKTLNIMKQNLSDDVFIQWCKKVASYHC